MRRFSALIRSDRMLPRAVALAVAIGFVFAEWASLQHLDAAACAESGRGAEHADATDGTWDRGEGEAARLFDFGALAHSELVSDVCHLCRTSRERLASPAASFGALSDRAGASSLGLAQAPDARACTATYVVAPKTSPPA